jgi:hypothetical protein
VTEFIDEDDLNLKLLDYDIIKLDTDYDYNPLEHNENLLYQMFEIFDEITNGMDYKTAPIL